MFGVGWIYTFKKQINGWIEKNKLMVCGWWIEKNGWLDG